MRVGVAGQTVSIFERGMIGTYHHMSEAHFGRYCAEFDMRYNTRSMNTASAPR